MTLSIDRFQLVVLESATPTTTLAEEVRAGLTAEPKRLPCRFFYDAAGSAIFDEICDLPEYYVTRAEREILLEHAGAIAALAPQRCTLVELGSGSASKTRLIIEALLQRQGALRYIPVDISRSALEESAQPILQRYTGLDIQAVAAEYQDGLRYLERASSDPKLILWLGSNVGNFERTEAATFLRQVRSTMTLEDRLLIGIDLRKDRSILEPAYDDAQGVTARFNKNLLVRINRELGGHFDLERFAHRAIYDERIGRIEMYLISDCHQVVRIDALELDIPFAAGESIHTENSYKYSAPEILDLGSSAGFAIECQWYDSGARFSENLFRPIH